MAARAFPGRFGTGWPRHIGPGQQGVLRRLSHGGLWTGRAASSAPHPRGCGDSPTGKWRRKPLKSPKMDSGPRAIRRFALAGSGLGYERRPHLATGSRPRASEGLRMANLELCRLPGGVCISDIVKRQGEQNQSLRLSRGRAWFARLSSTKRLSLMRQ